jgi:cobalamin biosynthesis Mg chelatase CobN
MAPQAPTMPAPPSASLNFPAAQAQAPRTKSSNVALYCILGGLFLVALFVVVFFALKG